MITPATARKISAACQLCGHETIQPNSRCGNPAHPSPAMTEKVAQMLAYDARMEELSEEMHRLRREADTVRDQRLALRMTLGYEDSQTYQAETVRRALDQVSAVRAGK